MRFRRGTCGLCKPTKRYKTNATRKTHTSKKEVLQEIPGKSIPPIGLREVNKD